jgi:hypothetical protein
MSDEATYMKVCDVCLLLDHDLGVKVCIYCEKCQAFICKDDIHRWDRRARAMAKRAALKASKKGCGCS